MWLVWSDRHTPLRNSLEHDGCHETHAAKTECGGQLLRWRAQRGPGKTLSIVWAAAACEGVSCSVPLPARKTMNEPLACSGAPSTPNTAMLKTLLKTTAGLLVQCGWTCSHATAAQLISCDQLLRPGCPTSMLLAAPSVFRRSHVTGGAAHRLLHLCAAQSVRPPSRTGRAASEGSRSAERRCERICERIAV